MPDTLKFFTVISLSVFLTACGGGSSNSSDSSEESPSTETSTENDSDDGDETDADSGTDTDSDTGGYTFNPSTPLSTLIVGTREFTSGTLTLENTDNSSPQFQASNVEGNYGNLTLFANGGWEYQLNANTQDLNSGQSVEDLIAFQLTDGSTLSVTFSIQTIEATESSVVFIFMNFSDASVGNDLSVSQIADMTFNDTDSLDNTYKENSLGQLKFRRHLSDNTSLAQYCYGEDNNESSSIDCFNYNIPDSQTGGVLSVANAQSRSGGQYTDGGYTWRDNATSWIQNNYVDANNRPVDLDDWRHRVYIYPEAAANADLVGTGVASVGGQWSIIVSDSDQLIMGHEIGHNIGLSHAGNDDNNDGDTNDNNESEYGSSGSFMGNGWQSRLFGSGHRDYMGWYDAFTGYTETVGKSANTTARIDLQAIELTAGELKESQPQLLKVESTGSRNGENYYYIEYHIDHDILNPRPYHENAVTIHYLRGSSSNNVIANQVATLSTPGDNFTDSSAGVTIEFESVDASNQSATISVSYSN
ncbi:VCBS domain-containing protein [Microbulbifer sp. OS29]|uniref:VCBS domain-containing protein n=1 Tax=Microbulbifer okhotskensis TaxID=2926617 RepID=A0A9X2J6H9_9GAMM|nr:VCBS domain-containing protein [Microbulbifer okhotskensis]MCO1336657.1 VCBS domain-containing protein [Microbulbifer okhotskensis]